MNSQQLKDLITNDIVPLLQSVDKVLGGNKIDEETIAFFQAVVANDWILDLLVKALGQIKK